jgi:molybdopterin converting factor small subunit
MRIYLGGHLNFYHPQKETWLEVKLLQPMPLKDVLEASSIPLGEVYLVVIEGELVDMQGTIVSDQSEVKLFPPVGGGC